MRDFFWDDVFRSNWDDMLAYSKTIEEFPTTGTMIVHWIRKVRQSKVILSYNFFGGICLSFFICVCLAVSLFL